MSAEGAVPQETPGGHRCLRLMRGAIDAFELDLRDLTVLTEAASGPFVVTPLLAALAGAHEVLALARDSRHGSGEEVAAMTLELAARLHVPPRIEIVMERDDARISQADVITNLGFVRPLDEPLLQRLDARAAVTLMCEPWELRAADVDVDACRRRGIPVLGTDESDPRLQTFRYLPLMAVKLLFDLGVEVLAAHVVVVSGGKFAAALVDGLRAMGARVALFAPPLTSTDADFEAAIGDADALIVADYPGAGPILGPAAAYTAAEIRDRNPGLGLVHLCGDVNADDVAAAGLRTAPRRIAPAGTMSVTAGYLGVRPVIDLHCAGLKVGEALARARRGGLEGHDAEAHVLRTLPVARGFTPPEREVD
jgi:hypothetical protein